MQITINNESYTFDENTSYDTSLPPNSSAIPFVNTCLATIAVRISPVMTVPFFNTIPSLSASPSNINPKSHQDSCTD